MALQTQTKAPAAPVQKGHHCATTTMISTSAHQSNAVIAGLRNLRLAMKKKVNAVEDWALGDHHGTSPHATRRSKGDQELEDDFDEELFSFKLHDYLVERDLDGAAEEFYMGNQGRGDFEKWLYKYMNLDEQRSTVFTHSDYMFEWVNRKYLLGARAIPDARPSDVRQNSKALFRIISSRISWPLPRQGIALAGSFDTDVNAIYCGMDPSSVTPWIDYPRKCRLCFAYGGLLYTGFVSDFSRAIELCGQSIDCAVCAR
mmetsp:Transcript_7091/g.12875  ORF Transcript_7091/g.12875 Transcript_7091/m.12875 type:complete len:258 (-) Transcript_7091:192-965(-)